MRVYSCLLRAATFNVTARIPGVTMHVIVLCACASAAFKARVRSKRTSGHTKRLVTRA
jgi:hypothetical protein